MKQKKALELLKNILDLANELQEKQNENLRIKKDTKPKYYFESNNEREIIICKDSKQVSPNLESLKEAILTGDGIKNKRVLKDEPTFTQPKEVGFSALYNGVIRVVNFNEKGISGTQFYGVEKVDVYINNAECSGVILDILDGYIVNNLVVFNEIKKISEDWVQHSNKLIIF